MFYQSFKRKVSRVSQDLLLKKSKNRFIVEHIKVVFFTLWLLLKIQNMLDLGLKSVVKYC